MKYSRISIAFIVVLATVFSACKPTVPDKALIQDIQRMAGECSVFLTANYTLGDTVVFVRENGNVERFIVQSIKTYLSNNQEEMPNEGFMYFDISVNLVGDKASPNTTHMAVYLRNSGANHSNPRQICAALSVPNVPYQYATVEQQAEEWTIVGEKNNIRCTLTKGIGITSFADAEGHTWQLFHADEE